MRRAALTVVLLGHTGVGKSAAGNTILGRKAFESKLSFKGVTKEICEQRAEVFGRLVSVVDTPGILGAEAQVTSWVQGLQQTPGPRLFLVVVKVDRFSEEQRKAVEAAEKVIGDQKFNSYLLFTRGDDLSDATLDDFINEDPEGPLVPVVQRFGRRRHVFNNKHGGPEQVRELLEKSGHFTDVPRPEIKREIVLLGLPGAGKSAAGNTILGSEGFKSFPSFNPVTMETVCQSATVEGRQVSVTDTPGLTGFPQDPKEAFMEIMKSVYGHDEGGGDVRNPHAFIMVMEIGRVLPPQEMMSELPVRLFGEDAKNYVMVLFTHADKLKGRHINEFIQNNESIRNLVSSCGGRYCVFNNTERGNREQVRELLEKIDQMVEANDGKPFTPERLDERLSQVAQTLSKIGDAQPGNRNNPEGRWERIKKWWLKFWRWLTSLFKKSNPGTGANGGGGYGKLEEEEGEELEEVRVIQEKTKNLSLEEP